jgi:hypothetical protein
MEAMMSEIRHVMKIEMEIAMIRANVEWEWDTCRP